MGTASANLTQIDFWQLVFSAPGATIAVCMTIIAVTIVIFLLSRRFPQISLQYGSSKLELKRGLVVVDSDVAQTGLASNRSVTVGGVKEATGGADSADDSDYGIFSLEKAVQAQDRAKIEKIFERFKIKPIGYAPYELEVWKNSDLLRAGFADARLELERIEREKTKESDASCALARYYLGIRAADQARGHIDILLARADSDEKRASAIMLKSDYIEAVDDRNTAIKFLLSEAGKLSELGAQSRIYEALGDKYRDQKRDGLAIAAYEVALRCDVHNKDARFQLAYAYSENDALQSLAVRHYRILLRQDPRYWSAENNLGVVYGKLGLNLYKIEAWKSAAERNEGYSIGNLMFAYLEAGLVESAEKLYEEAASYVKSNPRVIAAYTRLKSVRDNENERLDRTRERGEALWRELSKGNIFFETSTSDWLGEWKDAAGISTLRVTHSGEFLQVERFEGVASWKGYAKGVEGLTVVTVSQENKTSGTLSATLFAQQGQFIMFLMEQGLKVIHVVDDKVYSARIYTRVTQT
jgi:tetratricopeptide (TPR) repeat protein